MRYQPFAGSLGFTQLFYPNEDGINGVSKPESNAPLDPSLAYYRLGGYNGDSQLLTHDLVATDCGANLSVHYSEPSAWDTLAGTAQKPVLILTHGYPESSYIWRQVSPEISKRVPVFIPDQPGYGLSTPCCGTSGCAYDKRTYARAIMQAVHHIYGDSHVVYAGHDRGARTMVSTQPVGMMPESDNMDSIVQQLTTTSPASLVLASSQQTLFRSSTSMEFAIFGTGTHANPALADSPALLIR